MSHRFNRRALGSVAAACLFAVHSAGATTLYDPGLNTLPSAQGWTTIKTPDTVDGSQTVAGGILAFDSTPNSGAYGIGRASPVALDTVAGFKLSWDLRIKSEAHASDNRAGFSVLMQGADETKSLELGFWSDSVWALKFESGAADSGYLRGATASFDTTAFLHTYTLTVQNNLFSLGADSTTLLEGALRDYPTISSLTVPYSFSSFLFIGDNSSQGTSKAELGQVTLTPVPEPATGALLGAGLLGLAWLRRARAVR